MTSENKRNPPLALLELGYSIPYVSPFMDFFSNQEAYEKIPIYLKNTMFLNDENFQKYRYFIKSS